MGIDAKGRGPGAMDTIKRLEEQITRLSVAVHDLSLAVERINTLQHRTDSDIDGQIVWNSGIQSRVQRLEEKVASMGWVPHVVWMFVAAAISGGFYFGTR